MSRESIPSWRDLAHRVGWLVYAEYRSVRKWWRRRRANRRARENPLRPHPGVPIQVKDYGALGGGVCYSVVPTSPSAYSLRYDGGADRLLGSTYARLQMVALDHARMMYTLQHGERAKREDAIRLSGSPLPPS